MARPRVPQFGQWEDKGNDIPYTVVFDKAREGRGGKKINPNDPQENPSAFGGRAPPAKPQTNQAEPVRRGPIHERRASREDHGPKQSNGGRRGDGIGDGNRRTARTSIGSEHSVDRSPLHQYQPKATGRGNGSSSALGPKGSSSARSTPGRSGLTGLEDDRDKGASLPPFGGWDEKNPNAGAGLTAIFDNYKVREKHTDTPIITTETHNYSQSKQNNPRKKAKSSCFPWLR